MKKTLSILLLSVLYTLPAMASDWASGFVLTDRNAKQRNAQELFLSNLKAGERLEIIQFG